MNAWEAVACIILVIVSIFVFYFFAKMGFFTVLADVAQNIPKVRRVAKN
jgi:hypothetical protein